MNKMGKWDVALYLSVLGAIGIGLYFAFKTLSRFLGEGRGFMDPFGALVQGRPSLTYQGETYEARRGEWANPLQRFFMNLIGAPKPVVYTEARMTDEERRLVVAEVEAREKKRFEELYPDAEWLGRWYISMPEVTPEARIQTITEQAESTVDMLRSALR